MEFEWDENKNRANRLKHGIAFEDVLGVFDDQHRLTEPARNSQDEQRWQTIGIVKPFSVLFVVHARRMNQGREIVVRIISARPASRKERERYDRRDTEDRSP